MMPKKATSRKSPAPTEGSKKKKNDLVAFRLPEEYRPEWDAWKAQSEAEGIKEFREWLFPKVRQALAPKPKPAPIVDAREQFIRGQRLGMMVGRLDAVFELGQEDQLELGRVVKWAEKYPELAQDLVQILVQRSYGVQFDAWWTANIIGGRAPATARIPSGSR